ncbi:MAG: glycosyltransferase family 2 protein [Oryzomonas sp.]|uniref:dolichyl-phosphate beta-glucosyltransferase n=1 Tax=Oryzomonas sp. TaxID=2855186 RepID=UPI002845D21F|nr:glycosyltransferase family 2 protein [Oryzomonas sp.]MDR3580389.1 glycosyltransferase family 2 protein [Oryzomonas sp.]
MPSLSIIIPAYNEEDRLPRYLGSIVKYLTEKNTSYELIIVDDGSTDSTATVVEKIMETNPHVKIIRTSQNHGKGFAVKAGMLNACGKLRLFADADGATPIKELERLRQGIESGADIAIASRALHDGSTTVTARLHRKIIGTIFNLVVGLLAVQDVNDTQCGFKLFTEASANAIFPLQRISGFGFDVEILFICKKKGYRVKEIPVNWIDIKGSKVKLFRDSWKMFIDVIAIRLNDLRGVYSNRI